MKKLFVIVMTFCCYTAIAADKDKVPMKITHHVQFMFGDYVGKSAAHSTITGWRPQLYTPPGQLNYSTTSPIAIFYKPSFLPMFSYSVGFDYLVSFGSRFGLRTGLEYFIYGYEAKGSYNPCPECEVAIDLDQNYKRFVFTSSLLVPIHLVVYKAVGKGRLVFSTGTDIYLPINAFGKEEHSPVLYHDGLVWHDNVHYHLSANDFLRGGSLGYTVGLGYEKKLKGKMAIEFMPDFRVLNLVPFDFQGAGTHIYQAYIFNMALGLSTRLTFY